MTDAFPSMAPILGKLGMSFLSNKHSLFLVQAVHQMIDSRRGEKGTQEEAESTVSEGNYTQCTNTFVCLLRAYTVIAPPTALGHLRAFSNTFISTLCHRVSSSGVVTVGRRAASCCIVAEEAQPFVLGSSSPS